MRTNKAVSIDDFRKAAQRRLPKILFDWLEGGVEDEWLLRRNLAQFDAYRLVPRYLVDVKNPDQRTQLFDRYYDSPFGIAPTGFAGLLRPHADLMLARAAVGIRPVRAA